MIKSVKYQLPCTAFCMHVPSNITNDELSQASGGLITCFKPTLSRALDILSDSHTFIII